MGYPPSRVALKNILKKY